MKHYLNILNYFALNQLVKFSYRKVEVCIFISADFKRYVANLNSKETSPNLKISESFTADMKSAKSVRFFASLSNSSCFLLSLY